MTPKKTDTAAFFEEAIQKHGPWSKLYTHLMINRLHEKKNYQMVLQLSDDEEFKNKVHEAYAILNNSIDELLMQYIIPSQEDLHAYGQDYKEFLIETNRLKPDNAFSH